MSVDGLISLFTAVGMVALLITTYTGFEEVLAELRKLRQAFIGLTRGLQGGGASNDPSEEEEVKTTGAGAFSGMILGGLVGLLLLGAPGAILGGLLGAILGDEAERRDLEARRRRARQRR
ncbi:hypothetical protein B6U99_07370 [Candidatus Geothermarchaeota archaeon ex4572_27]|nr:MAG: hypothetical protein B6U99_07370 [Candidatus Geothermarchaeota archaeon ex4572_27]